MEVMYRILWLFIGALISSITSGIVAKKMFSDKKKEQDTVEETRVDKQINFVQVREELSNIYPRLP